jgi:hypothetical protein
MLMNGSKLREHASVFTFINGKTECAKCLYDYGYQLIIPSYDMLIPFLVAKHYSVKTKITLDHVKFFVEHGASYWNRIMSSFDIIHFELIDIDIIKYLCDHGCVSYNDHLCWYIMTCYIKKENITDDSVDKLCKHMLENTFDNCDDICESINVSIENRGDSESQSDAIRYLRNLQKYYMEKYS